MNYLIDSEKREYSYHSDDVLGEGTFGKVYKGKSKNGKPVAIKFINPIDHDDLYFVKYEVEILKKATEAAKRRKLSVVPEIYSLIEKEGNLFIVMELVDGLSLTKFIEIISINKLIRK